MKLKTYPHNAESFFRKLFIIIRKYFFVKIRIYSRIWNLITIISLFCTVFHAELVSWSFFGVHYPVDKLLQVIPEVPCCVALDGRHAPVEISEMFFCKVKYNHVFEKECLKADRVAHCSVMRRSSTQIIWVTNYYVKIQLWHRSVSTFIIFHNQFKNKKDFYICIDLH